MTNKVIYISIFALLFSLFSVDKAEARERAKVKIGNLGVKINSKKKNQSVLIEVSNNTMIVNFNYFKSKVSGLRTKFINFNHSIQFEFDGELASGKTFNFVSTGLPEVTAERITIRKMQAWTTQGVSTPPTASGTVKIKSYNPNTGRIIMDFQATVTPMLKGIDSQSQTTVSNVPVKAKINAIVDSF